MSNYSIQIFIEEALTPLSNGGKSLAGHMWFQIIENKDGKDMEPISAGYTSKGIVDNDNITYRRKKSTCESSKLPITKEAYEKLKEFAQPSNQKEAQENYYAKSLGFGIDDYNFLSNSCIDYVWKALELAGYNEKQFQGKLVPMQNCTIIEKVEPKTDNQSIIFDRFDFNHNIDSIFKPNSCFLFDFNLTQDSKQPLESHTTDSNPTQSNTESTDSTTPTTKEPQQAKESTTPNNNNPNTKNTNTFPFSLSIKDYNTFTPLQNKTIQLTNIDSKLTYTKQQKVSNAKECFR